MKPSIYDKFFDAVYNDEIEIVNTLLPTINKLSLSEIKELPLSEINKLPINSYKQIKNTFVTVLHIASKNGNLKMVQLLTNWGANKNAPSLEVGFNWISGEAIVYSESELTNIEKMLRNPPVETPLITAIKNNKFDICCFLLDQGANPNINFPFECALHAATAFDVEFIKVLIEKGADINMKSRTSSHTSLHCAVLNENFAAVQFLLKNNADTSKEDYLHKTAHQLVKNIKDELKGRKIEKLFTLGPDYNESEIGDVAINSIIYDKFFSAVCSNQPDRIPALLPEITEINMYKQANKVGLTALHIASEQGYLEMVNLLIAHNSDINALSLEAPSDFFTGEILSYSKHQLVNIKKMLSSCKATVETPLMSAIRNNHFNVAQLLITKGADINRTAGAFSRTPLHIAVLDENFAAVQLLLKNNANTYIEDTNGKIARELVKNNDIKQLFEIGFEYNKSEPCPIL